VGRRKPENPRACPKSAPPPKKKRKSHPRITKACRCADREHCHHAWINADEGAGTVVKGTGQMHWGHKASTLAFPGPMRADLPRGLDHLTPRGVPVCRAGYPFELLGVRHDTQHFLFAAPKDELGQSVCQGCDLREGCYRGQSGGRQVTIPQSRLPWLDPECPQLSKRFLKAMARRTSIERLHKLMKWDLGDEQLTKRGNDAFQARLDKTLLAMHVLPAHDA
jgi:hypothetical protein